MTCEKLAKQEAAVWMSAAKAIDARYPGAFARAEQLMLGAGKAFLTDEQARTVASDYLPTCFTPENWAIVEAMGFTSAALSQYVDRVAFARLIQEIQFGCNYRLTQQVISFDPAMSEMLELDQDRKEELVSDDGDPLPTDLLSRLPFDTFVVVPNYGDVRSFLVECTPRVLDGVKTLFLNIIARVPDEATGEVHQVNAFTLLTPGLNLADTVRNANEVLQKKAAPGARGLSAADAQKVYSVMAHVLPYLLYLCAENRELDGDLDTAPQLSKTKKGLRIFARPAPNLLQAGIRVGSAIRDARKAAVEGSGDQGVGGWRIPHLRIAHWHMYWTGPRNEPDKRKRVLHFLPPIPVNVRKPGDLQPVVRPAGLVA